ncbi:MAG: hypothetical protein ACXWK4_12120, partial [Myxococcaceae bacterium]
PPVKAEAAPVQTSVAAAAEQMASELSAVSLATSAGPAPAEGRAEVLVVEDNPEMARHVAVVLAGEA